MQVLNLQKEKDLLENEKSMNETRHNHEIQNIRKQLGQNKQLSKDQEQMNFDTI